MKYVHKHNLTESDQDVATLLSLYGINNIQEYLVPDRNSLYDPLLLDNIVTGAKLLIDHIKMKSHILLPPDSDLDGITAAAIMWNYIKKIDPQANLSFIMHDGKEHGLTNKILDNSYDVDLILMLDGGTNQVDMHKQVYDMGKDLIIIDHHNLSERLLMLGIEESPAIIINNQLSKQYQNKSLCGAGLAIKFCEVLDSLLGVNYAYDQCDLAAIGLIGDMMDLIDLETRYLVYHGLNNINNSGLNSLIEKQSYSIGDISQINPVDIAFYIAPLVNAMIRVGTESEKEVLFQAFINGDTVVPSKKRGAGPEDFETYASQNARQCVNARSRQNKKKDKAIDYIDMLIEKNDLNSNAILFIEVDDSVIEGELTGLVAMQLADKYEKPTIVTRLSDNDFLRGSGRNSNHSSLASFQKFLQNSNYFEYAEGHDNAFGVSIHKNRVNDFLDYANEYFKQNVYTSGVYYVDFIFSADSNRIDSVIYDIYELSSIWGRGVEEPIIAIEAIPITKKDIQVMGAKSDTCKFEYNGISYIQFRANKLIEQLSNLETMEITIIGRANVNEWNGLVTPQVFINDYYIKDTSSEF